MDFIAMKLSVYHKGVPLPHAVRFVYDDVI